MNKDISIFLKIIPCFELTTCTSINIMEVVKDIKVGKEMSSLQQNKPVHKRHPPGGG